MKNKITNKFRPRNCVYKLGRINYLSQPKNTCVKYYLKDCDDRYIAVLRRHTNILPVIAVVCIIIYIVMTTKSSSNIINIKYSDTMYIQKGLLSLDLLNESDYELEYRVYIEKGELTNGILDSKSSKSNVICNTDLSNGSYHGVLEIKSQGAEAKRDILIVVDNDL